MSRLLIEREILGLGEGERFLASEPAALLAGTREEVVLENDDVARLTPAGHQVWGGDGRPAERQYIIEKGILQRPLGGLVSQARAGTDGTANARADGWNRPPLDRMANLNLEPGDTPFDFRFVAKIAEGSSVNVGRVEMSVHTGSHVDAPLHFDDAGADAASSRVMIPPPRSISATVESAIQPR